VLGCLLISLRPHTSPYTSAALAKIQFLMPACEPPIDDMVCLSRRLLGLISFFTCARRTHRQGEKPNSAEGGPFKRFRRSC